ncbi:putative metal-dependent phosphoesterases (PHP family) [Methanocella conradii HZ254]|uniref:Metal-dependent phosphoesterases (PHP family) n=1 Tax=Methanocella conradii (strain DSM 24694 / JCM 17849 / CGMCC 1.5162 / HZ254) TaxID=1041930 RepID=H8I6J7_METCZ|nr:PHP domain-containing protein [Methanocella conradii]AFC98889.1 putative metal-dependent phosphoesterases (PHP family) [Methanocella conradii HZ254]
MLRFDLHVHTSYSQDGLSSVEEVLKAAAAAGLDGVAITDHDTTAGAIHALEIVDRIAPGLLVIPGIEVSTRSGHLIVLGVTRDIPARMSVQETIKEAKRLGGTIVVPHPYNRPRHGMPIPEGADAAEVYNSRHILGLHNRIALRRARDLGLPGVAGSDAHQASLVGSAITLIKADKTVNSVLESIKQGKTSIDVEKTPLHIYAFQMANGWMKKLKAIFIHKNK